MLVVLWTMAPLARPGTNVKATGRTKTRLASDLRGAAKAEGGRFAVTVTAAAIGPGWARFTRQAVARIVGSTDNLFKIAR